MRGIANPDIVAPSPWAPGLVRRMSVPSQCSIERTGAVCLVRRQVLPPRSVAVPVAVPHVRAAQANFESSLGCSDHRRRKTGESHVFWDPKRSRIMFESKSLFCPRWTSLTHFGTHLIGLELAACGSLVTTDWDVLATECPGVPRRCGNDSAADPGQPLVSRVWGRGLHASVSPVGPVGRATPREELNPHVAKGAAQLQHVGATVLGPLISLSRNLAGTLCAKLANSGTAGTKRGGDGRIVGVLWGNGDNSAIEAHKNILLVHIGEGGGGCPF